MSVLPFLAILVAVVGVAMSGYLLGSNRVEHTTKNALLFHVANLLMVFGGVWFGSLV